ncbi:meiotic recombination [Didymosphaeria variabile]|uniref:Double-strand break repair protein n=1 Tax=Didymosphaeria variabile TaxID=1932322 RepID=A0A9W9CBY9_9PLEO|nr:meiotic recombination [Didymosphaeria variabile]KAJ4354440.1 meiotic recombination [Didymosphaeria variabile]
MPSQASPQGSPPSGQAAISTDKPSSGSNVIRILVATDSHVGYNERDPVRKDDSWKSFHEVMCLAKEHDVDMVLHGGDLFHENKPSRMSMYHVTQSLRMNCLGDKPCELEMLSDASEIFGSVFDHVNYEDPNINVAIPVFAIHGNHDDPSGEGQYSALDLLQASGLVNYYGRTTEVDRIEVKPVLLQKGETKLALYGLSNVRDERLFHTWRNGDVKFYQPEAQTGDWFNLMTVHQNHVAHTATSYLPENFLPEFIDLVIWGHEHECLIEPRLNPEMGFQVIQPGSSVATSLMPGEAVPKHVTIISVDTTQDNRKFWSEPIRLKSVRPFIMKDIVLQEQREVIDRKLWRVSENKNKISDIVMRVVEEMIEQAQREWLELQDDRDEDEDIEIPLPLVRLRVEYTAPDPGEFKIENPQRLSNRFQGRVANVNDVVMFHRKKKTAARVAKATADLPDESAMAQLSIDTVKVEQLVKEFLTAQSLSILPQNSFGDAVAQFVDKDDKNALETFVKDSLASQQKHLLEDHDLDVDDLEDQIGQYKSHLEGAFAAGDMRHKRRTQAKARPDNYDSDFDGPWKDSPSARAGMDDEEDEEGAAAAPPKKAARGRGKATGTTRQTTAAAKKTSVAAKKAQAPRTTRGKKTVVTVEESNDDDDDVVMLDEVNHEQPEEPISDAEDLFVGQTKRAATKKPTTSRATRATSPVKKTPASRTKKAPASKQSTLNFSQTSTQRAPTQRAAASRASRAVEEVSRVLLLIHSIDTDLL